MTSSVEEENTFSSIFLGDDGVGKNALICRFVWDAFDGNYDPLAKRNSEVRLDDKVFHIDFLFCTEEYAALNNHYKEMCDTCLLVYSVTQRESFDAIDGYVKELVTLKKKEAQSIKMVLCGNKSDLAAERSVSAEEGMAMAELLGCPFIETSAKTRENVDEVMRLLARRFLSPDPPSNSNVGMPKSRCIVC